MAKGLTTPRAKRGQRTKSSASTKPKPGRVTKPKKRTSGKGTPVKVKKHGMKTRARAQQLSQSFDALRDSQSVKYPQTLSTLKTPEIRANLRPKSSLREALSLTRSFWAPIKDSTHDPHSFGTNNSGDDDINTIMNRLNRQVSNQIDSYKYENFGFLSSSQSGYDPRETIPINEEEVEDLQMAIWPTLQHIVELTNFRPLFPHSKACYLTQLRHVRQQLCDTWQIKGFPGNPPSPFQLEAWSGGITNWRTSYYTNGEDRFPASLIETHIEAWRSGIPSTPAAIDTIIASGSSNNNKHSDPEIFHARHEFNHNNTSPTPSRRVLSALYDSTRDTGFLPTASHIRAYQSGTVPTTTLLSLSMRDTGISSPPNNNNQSSSWIFPRRRRSVRIFEDLHTPSPSIDDHTAFGEGGELNPESDKENDAEQAARMERVERQRESTPSSSQDAIDPVGERMVRMERLEEEWE
ncbi:MAG: hypothetical protein Q9225_006349, partial [Loekoesia sp. 1 TL-2023]